MVGGGKAIVKRPPTQKRASLHLRELIADLRKMMHITCERNGTSYSPPFCAETRLLNLSMTVCSTLLYL